LNIHYEIFIIIFFGDAGQNIVFKLYFGQTFSYFLENILVIGKNRSAKKSKKQGIREPMVLPPHTFENQKTKSCINRREITHDYIEKNENRAQKRKLYEKKRLLKKCA
jgi:hypothetical protein